MYFDLYYHFSLLDLFLACFLQSIQQIEQFIDMESQLYIPITI